MLCREIPLPDGWRLLHYDCLESTSSEALNLASNGAEEGTIVWATRQTAGRGRQGRAWESLPGNLLMSIILRPKAALLQRANLGFVVALAIADAVAPFIKDGDIALKWPNDVLCSTRKVAGILLESGNDGRGENSGLVVGIGINIETAPESNSYPTICLRDVGASHSLGPAQLLSELAWQMEKWYRIWREQGFAPIRSAWLARAVFLGQRIEARTAKGVLSGIFEDLDQDGALLLRGSDGNINRILAADIYPWD